MNTRKTIVLLSVVAGLGLSAGAQAFCFMKGNNNNGRMHDYYSQSMPAVGFSPVQHYGQPYPQQPGAGWYGYPVYTPGYPVQGMQPGMPAFR